MSAVADVVREAFQQQAKACGVMGSPFMENLCLLIGEHLNGGTVVGAHCLNWAGNPEWSADNVPLRLCGGLHALVLKGEAVELAKFYPGPSGDIPSWALIEDTLRANESFFLDWLKSPPQTNEVSRSAIIWPAFMEIAARSGKPLRLLELGASGGLNLNADLYRYTLGDAACGQPESPLNLVPEWKGAACSVSDVAIVEKNGCDLSPIDLTEAFDRLRLRAYVWPDQAERMERLNAALAIAQSNPVEVEKADAIEWLEQSLSALPDNMCTVIFSTVAWQYFPDEAKRAGEAIVAKAAARADQSAPLAWLQFETDGRSPGGVIRLRLWPEATDQSLGRADFHGRWVDWQVI